MQALIFNDIEWDSPDLKGAEIEMKVVHNTIRLVYELCCPIKPKNQQRRAIENIWKSNGRVIGVPNSSDPRNNRYETYYYSVDSNGNYSNGSAFKVTGNPHHPVGGGFVRIDVAPQDSEGQTYEGNNNGDVMVYDPPPENKFQRDPTVSYNNDNIDKSRYDFGGEQPARYGDF